ncbi:MAG: hypothetical protein GEV13_17250 [Rhodospirillales bacterium]|nr:hypothetical protein [Rhodospirillales bacterium]
MISGRAHLTFFKACIAAVFAAAFASSSALAGELLGFKGSKLRGSISCVHPNLTRDLLDRIGSEEDYTTVARLYIQQGYCVEADVPTVLVKPLADQRFPTWSGHQAEIWETTLVLKEADGTSQSISSFSIVFPVEMDDALSL